MREQTQRIPWGTPRLVTRKSRVEGADRGAAPLERRSQGARLLAKRGSTRAAACSTSVRWTAPKAFCTSHRITTTGPGAESILARMRDANWRPPSARIAPSWRGPIARVKGARHLCRTRSPAVLHQMDGDRSNSSALGIL